MAHFDKHSKSITALVDVSEAMLNAMEKHGIDPETVSTETSSLSWYTFSRAS